MDANEYARVHMLMFGMGTLTDEEVAELESRVQGTPDDLDSRIRLLSRYFTEQFNREDWREARAGHVLWMIEHEPLHIVHEMPVARFHAHFDPEAYEAGRALWMAHVGGCDDVLVLCHAAAYLTLPDGVTASALLERAISLEPEDANLWERLGFVLALGLLPRHGQVRADEMSRGLRAMAAYERAAELGPLAPHSLRYVLQAAFASEDLIAVGRVASELIAAQEVPGSADQRAGNVALAWLAELAGDVDGRGAHLAAAGVDAAAAELEWHQILVGCWMGA